MCSVKVPVLMCSDCVSCPWFFPPKDGVMTCFQITASAKHSLDIAVLENSALNLGITKIVIYWVVPRGNFREFNRKQISGHRLAFEQRVLSLDAPHNPFTEPEMQKRLQTAELSKLTTKNQQLLKQETDELKLRYLVMKSVEEQDVKNMINAVLRKAKKRQTWILWLCAQHELGMRLLPVQSLCDLDKTERRVQASVGASLICSMYVSRAFRSRCQA